MLRGTPIPILFHCQPRYWRLSRWRCPIPPPCQRFAPIYKSGVLSASRYPSPSWMRLVYNAAPSLTRFSISSSRPNSAERARRQRIEPNSSANTPGSKKKRRRSQKKTRKQRKSLTPDPLSHRLHTRTQPQPHQSAVRNRVFLGINIIFIRRRQVLISAA